MNVSSPSLVFDEVFRPCAVYVALHRPDIVAKTFGPDSWIVSHIKQAIEAMNKPVPDFTKPRRRS